MNPAIIAKLLQGVGLVSQVIQMAIQAGQTVEQLKTEFDRLKQLINGMPLTPMQEAALFTRHEDLTNTWLAELGPRPEDAA